MNDDNARLIDGYWDDHLKADELRRVNDLLRNDTAFAEQFAKAALLHDRLRTEVAVASVSSREPVSTAAARSSSSRRSWSISLALTTAACLLIGFLWQLGGGTTPASAASVALERIISAAARTIDRVYRIQITDFGPGGPQPQAAADRGGVKPHVDGAELYVRGRDQFVLVRRFADGSPFVTGSDGEVGWAVPPTGHVHLSRDVRRFRRAVPGERDAIPFLDLEAGLEELRRDYDLELVEAATTEAGPAGWSRLEARKHPHVRGGAERVQIWFDAAGTAHRIVLQGLPQDEPDGSPRAVELNLAADRDVPKDVFHHESHHSADRPQSWE